MEVRNLQIDESPRMPDFTRLSVEVRYHRGMPKSESVWFEVPRTVADQASRGGNPWLVALLPLAMVLREEISLTSLPVDDRLLDNLHRLMAIWSQWYLELAPVAIEADRLPLSNHPSARKTASFFSGGVDSFYTLLYDRAEGGRTIEELILIHGADILVSNEIAFRNARAGVTRVASALELPVVTIATNLRSTLFRITDWNGLSFGALMAAAALILEERYASCLVPSTGRRGGVPPPGSHPETDPLFSTSKTQFVHHGGWMDRVGKTAMISGHPIALQEVRVCWESEAGGNCSRCSKCLRTMATLDVLSKLAFCPVFEQGAPLTARIRRLYLSHERPFMLDVRDFAAERGRSDLVDAIDGSVRRTDLLNRWLLLAQVQRLSRRFAHNPLARRFIAAPYDWLRRLASRVNRLTP